MFIQHNAWAYLNKEKITKIRVDERSQGTRLKFFEGPHMVAKSDYFDSTEAARAWVEKNFAITKEADA